MYVLLSTPKLHKRRKIMAFKTKREKYAYFKGIKKGMKGGKPYSSKNKMKAKGRYIDGIFESDFAMRGAREAAKRYDQERERNAARMGVKLPF